MVYTKVRWQMCPTTVVYEPKKESLVERKVFLSNLRSYTEYKIVIASRNGVSDLQPDKKPAMNSIEIRTNDSSKLATNKFCKLAFAVKCFFKKYAELAILFFLKNYYIVF